MWKLYFVVVGICVLSPPWKFTKADQVQLDKISDDDSRDDLLKPYSNGHFDRKRNHRYVRDCQHIKHGNTTFEIFHAPHQNHTEKSVMRKLKYLNHKITKRKSIFETESRYVHGHLAVVDNPLETFSVLLPEQKSSCSQDFGDREKVSVTSTSKKCILATNAGFFNTHTGGCLGNIVTNGKLAHDSRGIQNANFGIKRDGTLITGYLPEDEVTSNEFVQLISGVGWLVRNGEVYVNQSLKAECADTEETGTIQRFFDVVSARTAIGHDEYGRIMIAQIDGKTDKDGVSLLQFANLLKKHGAINAINLDGGGSSTFVINGSVANYPSDSCGDDFSCERKVSTIICIHEPDRNCDCTDSDSACSSESCNSSEVNNSQSSKQVQKQFAKKEQRKLLNSDSDSGFEDVSNIPQYKERSFAILWFVALSAILACSLLGNVYLIHIFRSRKSKETNWKASDLRSLLEEDSDGV